LFVARSSWQRGWLRRKLLARLCAPLFATASLSAGVGSQAAVYRGGTLETPLPSASGEVSARGEQAFLFRYDGGELRILYDQVNLLEYGQKAGRRLVLAITVSPLFLLSKRHRHYLTIGFLDDEGRQQAAVFELGKKIVRSTLSGLEARTGRRVEYENEEARTAARR
jgi:hypothetical protein